MDPQLQRFYRQYIQQFSHLTFPPGSLLKQDDIQTALEQYFFNDTNATNIPTSYQARTLDKIIQLIEGALKDPENEAVSDFLFQQRAGLATQPHIRGLAAFGKSKLVYTAPTDLDTPAPQLTINEAKNIIGSGPSTGLRTWEASLRLAHYLFLNENIIHNRNILELGAGTGFLSLFCTLVLRAKDVIATDGNEQVLDSLRENLLLSASQLETESCVRPTARQLPWEEVPALTSALTTDAGEAFMPDIVLGADVTYHPDANVALGALLSKLIELNPAAQIYIAATERSVKTVEDFLTICRGQTPKLASEDMEFKCPVHLQKGLFHSVVMPIKILRIFRDDGEAEGKADVKGGS